MSDLVLAALMRNREIAKKAGQLERVERLDARLAQLEGRERSAEPEVEPEEVPEEEAAADIEDYSQGGGWYLIRGEKVQGRAAALALLNADDED